MSELAIACSCGALRGVLHGASPGAGNHLVCYCDDCQSFAHFLGDAQKTLDAHGGTAIFQTSSGRVELSQGREKLACVQLRPGGLVRWYAGCCNTPIGNTLGSASLPFVGLIHRCVDPLEREAALGPIRGGVQAKFAKGDRSRLDASDGAFGRVALRFLRVVLAARLRGDGRRSPFFEASSGALVVTPQVLSKEELQRVESTRDAFAPEGGVN